MLPLLLLILFTIPAPTEVPPPAPTMPIVHTCDPDFCFADLYDGKAI